MAIEITNNGVSLKILIGAQTRFIMKSQIQEIVVVKGDTIKIDIGKGALYNVFIPFADVTSPALANVDLLRDAINEMLSGVSAGSATEARQVEEIAKLDELSASVGSIKQSVTALDNKAFFEPLLIDESHRNVIYKGFANPGSRPDLAVWAIQKVSNVGDVCSYQWADGDKNFDNIWNNRETLSYS